MAKKGRPKVLANSPQLVTYRVVAQKFGIPLADFREYVFKGKFPMAHNWISQTWFYRADAIDRKLQTGNWPSGEMHVWRGREKVLLVPPDSPDGASSPQLMSPEADTMAMKAKPGKKRGLEDSPQLVTLPEVAEKFGVTSSTLRGWVRRGEFPRPHIEIGTKWFYKADIIDHKLRTGTWLRGVKFQGHWELDS